MSRCMLKIDNVSKQYKLGQIGGTTLREELQRRHAKLHGLEDPTKKIGERDISLGETFYALQGISFEVQKGERIGIIGHNGAGKSTLLKLISRVTAPTDGTISLDGRITSMLEVGTGFHGELTGRENIYMNGAILGMTRREIDQKIEDIIDFSECRQFIDTPVKRYSSGMYVKLAFSVAAHLNSEIMIMDEVLAVGDMAFQKKCLDKMREVSNNNGRTILYVSHNMNTIKQLCNRTIVLEKGKIIFDGDVDTGISKYLNISDAQLRSDIDCRYLNHFRDGNDDITITSIRIINKSEPRCYEGDVLIMKINFDVKVPYDDTRIRFSVQNGEKFNVGMALSDVFQVNTIGSHSIKVSFDTTGLTQGEYSISVGITKIKPEERKMNTIDYISNSFKLIVEERLDTQLIWSQSLGNWRMNSLQICKSNQEDIL